MRTRLYLVRFATAQDYAHRTFQSGSAELISIDDCAKDGGEELFAKIHCVLIIKNP